MGFFDFDQAEREERDLQPVQGRGDTLRTLVDHRWMSFALIAFVVAVLAHLQELLAMVAFMVVVLLAAWLWSRSSLRGLVYHRQFRYRRFFPDENFDVNILVENRKLLPLPWFQTEDEWSVHVGPSDEFALARSEYDPDSGFLINTYSLRWYERIRRTVTLTARRRGVFDIGPVTLVSGDPFSLFDRKLVIEDRHEALIVYPRIKTLPELGLPLKDPFGDHRVQRRLFEDPNRTMGIRDYSPTDSFRHIHWKATARTGSLQTRVYEPTRSQRTVLCLNVATFEIYWRGVWPAMLDYVTEVAASLAHWGLEQGHSVGITANGTLAHADQPFRILPSRSPDQLTHVLEALAAVSYFVSSSFDRFLLDESPRLPWGATLVLITPFMNEAIGASILRLRDSGRRLVLICLGKSEPPVIPRVLTYHLPIQDEEPPLPSEEEEDDELPSGDEHLTPRQRYLRRRAREEAERAKQSTSSTHD
ncbi:MAG: DUF58 domain-containing protein [Anaerolineae bacterium]|nr:DUF58 domain-containing protein [Anaerolineae bacterium]